MGFLYPAYYSFKAVKTKDVQGYVRWMMYWIVFAIFTTLEVFTDTLLSWFPMYYEAKLLLLFWLISPSSKGSSIVYRRIVHPWLVQREPEIDAVLITAQERGYNSVIQIGQRALNYISGLVVERVLTAPNLVAEIGAGVRGGQQRQRNIPHLDFVSDEEMEEIVALPQLQTEETNQQLEEPMDREEENVGKYSSATRKKAGVAERVRGRGGKKQVKDLYDSSGDEDSGVLPPRKKR